MIIKIIIIKKTSKHNLGEITDSTQRPEDDS